MSCFLMLTGVSTQDLGCGCLAVHFFSSFFICIVLLDLEEKLILMVISYGKLFSFFQKLASPMCINKVWTNKALPEIHKERMTFIRDIFYANILTNKNIYHNFKPRDKISIYIYFFFNEP